MGRAQWAVTLGMLPALLALFQQFSLVSPLANALAIPLVSFVITPLALLGSLPLLDPLLSLAHSFTTWLMIFIDWLAALPLAIWQQAAPPAWAVLLALAGGLWLLLPRGFPSRWLGLLAFPAAADGASRHVRRPVPPRSRCSTSARAWRSMSRRRPRPAVRCRTGVFRRGRQRQPHHRALSAGDGRARLDTLVISHADKDHEGGAASVLAALPVAMLKPRCPSSTPCRRSRCRTNFAATATAGTWDGVRFEMLHPGAEPLSRKTNDLSCVLRVSAGGKSMLLTSDIEAVSEAHC
jgi:competence protein ComEC